MSARDRLIDELRAHALVVGDVVLTSGRTAAYYVDAKRASCARRASRRWPSSSPSAPRAWGATAVGGLSMGADPSPAPRSPAARTSRRSSSARTSRPTASQRRIEGPLLDPGDRCLIVEDVVTTGGSTLAGDRGAPRGGPRDRRRRGRARPPGRRRRTHRATRSARPTRRSRRSTTSIPTGPIAPPERDGAGGLPARDERAGVRAHAGPAFGEYANRAWRGNLPGRGQGAAGALAGRRGGRSPARRQGPNRLRRRARRDERRAMSPRSVVCCRTIPALARKNRACLGTGVLEGPTVLRPAPAARSPRRGRSRRR